MTSPRPSEANLLILDAIARSLPCRSAHREVAKDRGINVNAVHGHLLKLRGFGLIAWEDYREGTLWLTPKGRRLADERLLLRAVAVHHAAFDDWPRASTLEAHPDADAIGRALARMVRAGAAG